ncbi:7371_t:CDS:2, partial [Gigaspora rosea]
MATSEVSKESSRKRHQLFSENTDELSSEIEDSQTTTTIAITVATDTSSQISIVTHPSSSKNESQLRFDELSSLDDITSDNSTTLLIEDIVDLTAENNSRPEEVAQVNSADLDYDPRD